MFLHYLSFTWVLVFHFLLGFFMVSEDRLRIYILIGIVEPLNQVWLQSLGIFFQKSLFTYMHGVFFCVILLTNLYVHVVCVCVYNSVNFGPYVNLIIMHVLFRAVDLRSNRP